MILYYDHKRRQIFREDVGNHSIPITIDEAREAWNKVGTIKDSNVAFQTLARLDFDMGAVERHYA